MLEFLTAMDTETTETAEKWTLWSVVQIESSQPNVSFFGVEDGTTGGVCSSVVLNSSYSSVFP